MNMKFGVGMLTDSLWGIAERAKLADELGLDLVRIADSQCLFRDLYVSLTLVALHTTRCMIGPGVTNPVTRHPTVTAGAIASIDELSGGRAILGIGAGDSAVFNIGERPAGAQALKEYVVAVRELFQRGETVYRGRLCRLTWPQRAVPIWVAAAGPRALRVAGEVADVVVMGSGFLPECVKDDLAFVEEGARAAGRSLKDVEIWVFGPGNVGATRAAAIEPVKAATAATGHLSFARGVGRNVPPELAPAVMRLVEGYRSDQHQQGVGSHNARLVDELGLTDYMARRFALAGTRDECVEQARALAAVGVQGLMLTIVTPDPLRTIRDLGEQVLPAFR